MNILKFVKSLTPRIEKDRVLEDIEISINELDTIVIPSYRTASDHFKVNKFQSAEVKRMASKLGTEISSREFSRQANIVGDLLQRLQNVLENLKKVQDLSEAQLERDTINEGVSAKKVVLIRAADNINFISRYSIRLLDVFYTLEAIENGADVDESGYIPPVTRKFIEKYLINFAGLLNIYAMAPKKFQEALEKTPDIMVGGRADSAVAAAYKEVDVDPLGTYFTSNFTYSPIYFVRKIVAEWQASRYKAHKDRKKLLELKLLHLKLLNEKRPNAAVEKEIVYIQNRIEKAERYLDNVDASLGGDE